MKIKALADLVKIVPSLSCVQLADEVSVTVSPKNLSLSLFCLKYHINFQYKMLSCISGIDFLHHTYRFGVIYELISLVFNSRLRVKVFVNEITSIVSSVSVYKNADWWEREIWDMFGVFFVDHPDLRRILTDYGFEGHPLRKDFPLSGYSEIRYDFTKKHIVSEPVELTQESRVFLFGGAW